MTFSKSNRLITAAAVSIVGILNQEITAAPFVGLDLYNGGGNSVGINSTTREYSTRFTADQSISVDTATYYLNSFLGTPNVQIAIRADDGSGAPTGIDLASGASVPSVNTGYNTVSISPVSLTAGQVYHLVYRVTNGDSNNSISLRQTAPGYAGVHAHNGTVETNAALLETSNNGGSWATYTNNLLSWGLYDSDTSAVIGQPYSAGSYAPTGLDIWQGQSFTFTGSPAESILNSVSMKIYKGVAVAADDLRIYLIDTTTGDALWSDVLMLADAPVTSGTGDVVSVAVPDVALVNGQKYILALESTGSAVYDFQMATNVSSAQEPLLGANFQEEYSSSWVRAFSYSLPSSFVNLDSASSRTDAYFKLSLAAIPEPSGLVVMSIGLLALGRRQRMS